MSSLDAVFWPIGLCVIGVGIAIRVWARQHIRDSKGNPVKLATTGPYAMVRHPLHVGNGMLFVGAAILFELPWAPPVVLMWCGLIYAIATRWEEARCLDK